MDLVSGEGRLKKDRDLSLYRVRARSRRGCMLISAKSIVRGAMLADAYDIAGDFLAIDVVDSDMFLRLKSSFPF